MILTDVDKKYIEEFYEFFSNEEIGKFFSNRGMAPKTT